MLFPRIRNALRRIFPPLKARAEARQARRQQKKAALASHVSVQLVDYKPRQYPPGYRTGRKLSNYNSDIGQPLLITGVSKGKNTETTVRRRARTTSSPRDFERPLLPNTDLVYATKPKRPFRTLIRRLFKEELSKTHKAMVEAMSMGPMPLGAPVF